MRSIVVLATAVSVLMCGCKKAPEKPAALPKESETERKAAIKKAFADRDREAAKAGRKTQANTPVRPTRSRDDDKRAIADLFETLRRGMQSRETVLIQKSYDFIATIGHMAATNMIDAELALKLRAKPQLVATTMAKAVLRGADYTSWIDHRIVTTRFTDGGTAAVVYLKQRLKSGGSGKNRYWIKRSLGNWRIVDQEDVTLGIRFSTMMAIGIGAKKMGIKRESMALLGQIIQFAVAEQYDKLSKHLPHFNNVRFPPLIHALLEIARSFDAYYKKDVKGAFAALVRAEKLNPELVLTQLLRGGFAVQEGLADKAIAACNRYVELLGPDSDIDRIYAAAYVLKNDLHKAAKYARRCLDDNADSPYCLITLVTASPPTTASEVEARFKKLADPAQTTHEMLTLLKDNKDAASAKSVLTAFKAAHPNNPRQAELEALTASIK